MTEQGAHIVRSPLLRRAATWVALPAAGAAVGVAAAWVIDLTARGALHRVTVDAPFEWWRLGIGALVGLAVGLLLAVGYTAERLRARIDDNTIHLAWDQIEADAPRHSVGAVVADGDLVVLSRTGSELIRVPARLDVGQLDGALRAHGYPALTRSDPFEDQFTPWRSDDTALSETVHRYVAAYESSLGAHCRTDAEHLRRALVAQGVAVRARGGHVEWRRLSGVRLPLAA